MDLGWTRAHHLVIILVFLKHAVAQEGWLSQNVQPQQNWPVHEHVSLRGIQSSVLEAPVTRSIPVEEVAPNKVSRKSLNDGKSRFSLSRQYVKGGFSSSYEPVSHTQSAPSVLDRTSLLKLLDSSSPSAQNVVRQDSYSWSSQDGSGLQGVSAQLASTPVRGGSSSALSILSQSSSSRSTPDSLPSLNFSPFDVSGLPTSDQSSSNMFTASSQDSSGLHLGGASSPLSTQSSSSTGSSGSSRRLFTATYQGSSGPQLAEGSSQLVSTSGLLTQPPSTESQNTSGSSYAKLAASPLGFSPATSGQSSYSQYTSSSQSRVGTQLAGSSHYAPGHTGSTSTDGSSLHLQGTSTQYAPALSLGAKKMSSQFHQATLSGSLSPSQSSPGWQPTITKTQGFQSSSKAVSQGSGTSQSSIWSPSRFSSLQSQSTSSQNAPAPLGAKGPVYSLAAPSGSSLSLRQPSQLHSPASRSHSFQTSGAMASQSSSPSQGFKAPGRLSTSAASPGQFASTQEGSASYSGSSIQSSTSSQYSPESSGYTKLAASPLGVSQSTSGHGSYSQYTSSSQSRAGTQLAGSSPYTPGRTGSTFTDGSSLQLQGTSGWYAPLNAKVYSQAAPSGPSLSPSQSSPWQTSSRWSQGFQTSGTVASPSSSPSQGSKAPSRFSTSAVRPGQLASTQKESGRYGGLFSTSTRYSPGSPAYAKRGSSLLDVSSQSASGQISYSQNTLSSQSKAGTQLAGSSPYVPVQSVSTFTDGSSLLQGTSTQYVPAALGAKVPAYSQTAPSGSLSLSQPSQWQTSSRWSQGFQTSGTVASRSNSPSQGSKAPKKFSTLASPGQFISTQEGRGRYSGLSSLSQGTSSQYSSGSPAYAKRGSSLLEFSSQSTSDPSSSGLYASSSQSMAGTQLAGSSSVMPAQTGSPFTGASFQFQGTSNRYAPSVTSQYTPASSESSLTGSEAFQKWQPSSSPWSQWFQASGTAVPLSSSSPQSVPTSSVSSFLPAQSSISSSRNSVVSGTGLGPSKISAQAASGSAVSSQTFPGLSASVHHPSGSMTSSLGSSVQGALQGTVSGPSSDSTSLISSSYGSTYGQKASGFSRPSQSSSATGRYSSSVKG